MLDPRGDDILRKKEQTKRTQRMIGTCKGSFTIEIKKFIQTAEYFLSKDTDHSDDEIDLPGVWEFPHVELLLNVYLQYA